MPLQMTIVANGSRDPQTFRTYDSDTGQAVEYGNDTFVMRYGVRRPDGDLSPMGELDVTHEVVTVGNRTYNEFTIELDADEALGLEAGSYQLDWLRVPEDATTESDWINHDTGTMAIQRGVSE